MTLHDRRVHVEHDVLSGPGALAGVMAAARGSAPVCGELPDPTTLVRTGCRQLRALVTTSRLPEESAARRAVSMDGPSIRSVPWTWRQPATLVDPPP
jgi:hypothetical protein